MGLLKAFDNLMGRMFGSDAGPGETVALDPALVAAVCDERLLVRIPVGEQPALPVDEQRVALASHAQPIDQPADRAPHAQLPGRST